MANAPSRTVLIAAAVLAAGVAVISNLLMQRLDPKEQERLEREAAAKATPVPTPSVQAVPAPAAAGGTLGDLAALSSGKVIGSPTGTPKVEVRFEWTPTVQADPNKVVSMIQRIQQAVPNAAITVRSIDDTPEGEAGVFVGGSRRIVPLPDGGFPPLPAQGIQALITGQPAK